MKKQYYAVLCSSYCGCDEKYEFEADENASEDELNEIAYRTITDNMEFHVEEKQ